jgi:hypothetical protein
MTGFRSVRNSWAGRESKKSAPNYADLVATPGTIGNSRPFEEVPPAQSHRRNNDPTHRIQVRSRAQRHRRTRGTLFEVEEGSIPRLESTWSATTWKWNPSQKPVESRETGKKWKRKQHFQTKTAKCLGDIYLIPFYKETKTPRFRFHFLFPHVSGLLDEEQDWSALEDRSRGTAVVRPER